MRGMLLQNIATSGTRLMERVSKIKKLFRAKHLKYKMEKASRKELEILKKRVMLTFPIFYGIVYSITGENAYLLPSTIKEIIGLRKRKDGRWRDVRDDTFLYRFLNELTEIGWIEKTKITKNLRNRLERYELVGDSFLKRKIRDKVAYRFLNIKKYEGYAIKLSKNEKFERAAKKVVALILRQSAPLLDILTDKRSLREFTFVSKNVVRIVTERVCSHLRMESEREAFRKYMSEILKRIEMIEKFHTREIRKKLPSMKKRFYRAAERLLREANSIT